MQLDASLLTAALRSSHLWGEKSLARKKSILL